MFFLGDLMDLNSSLSVKLPSIWAKEAALAPFKSLPFTSTAFRVTDTSSLLLAACYWLILWVMTIGCYSAPTA